MQSRVSKNNWKLNQTLSFGCGSVKTKASQFIKILRIV